jgi:WD40 repeat protein
MDIQSPLVAWDLNGGTLHTWSNKRRVGDLALSPDGQRLVTIVKGGSQVSVYNFVTREEEYTMNFQTEMTCVNISRDSKYMLINMANSEIQLINIETAAPIRTYRGKKQGEFVIRSTFGGTVENLVISGSEGIYPRLQI